MDDKHLDELLDRAVATYVPEASPLLEERILQVARESRTKPRRLPFYAAAACALAAMLTMFMSFRPSTKPEEAQPHWASLTVAPASAPLKVLAVHDIVRPRTRKRISSPPKKEVFLASTPMTQEELALVSFVQRSPAKAAEAFAELEKRSSESLQIEALSITPLSAERHQEEKNE